MIILAQFCLLTRSEVDKPCKTELLSTARGIEGEEDAVEKYKILHQNLKMSA